MADVGLPAITDSFSQPARYVGYIKLLASGRVVVIATGSHSNFLPTRIDTVPRLTISVKGTEYSKFDPARSGLYSWMAFIHSLCGFWSAPFTPANTRGYFFGGSWPPSASSLWRASGRKRGLLQ